MLKRKNKKKKGFTLIELVIVLAVLAIIALIAIPNFNKVRTDSQKKADLQTCETIKNVTLMAIADQDMVSNATTGASFIVSGIDKTNTVIKVGTVTGITWKKDGNNNQGLANYKIALKEVKAPQEKTKKNYKVIIGPDESVKVEATEDALGTEAN